jgi:hypothetical protein
VFEDCVEKLNNGILILKKCLFTNTAGPDECFIQAIRMICCRDKYFQECSNVGHGPGEINMYVWVALG